MKIKEKYTLIFTTSSLFSFFFLVLAFCGDLLNYSIYTYKEKNIWGNYQERLIQINENDRVFKQTLNEQNLTLVGISSSNQMVLKLISLICTILCSGFILVFGDNHLNELSIQSSVDEFTVQAQTEIRMDQVKNKFALASKALQQQLIEELQALADLGQESFNEELEADEISESKNFKVALMLKEDYTLEEAVSITWEVDQGTEKHQELIERFLKSKYSYNSIEE
jgi:hypothetical protein